MNRIVNHLASILAERGATPADPQIHSTRRVFLVPEPARASVEDALYGFFLNQRNWKLDESERPTVRFHTPVRSGEFHVIYRPHPRGVVIEFTHVTGGGKTEPSRKHGDILLARVRHLLTPPDERPKQKKPFKFARLRLVPGGRTA